MGAGCSSSGENGGSALLVYHENRVLRPLQDAWTPWAEINLKNSEQHQLLLLMQIPYRFMIGDTRYKLYADQLSGLALQLTNTRHLYR